MTGSFHDHMAALDAIVAQCRDDGAFATDIVRDSSNRSGRDWPWWGFNVERTRQVDLEYRRAIAGIVLNAPAPGVASVFKGSWSARIWRDAGVDSFRAQGDRRLSWVMPSAQELIATLDALLAEAEQALREAASAG